MHNKIIYLGKKRMMEILQNIRFPAQLFRIGRIDCNFLDNIFPEMKVIGKINDAGSPRPISLII